MLLGPHMKTFISVLEKFQVLEKNKKILFIYKDI